MDYNSESAYTLTDGKFFEEEHCTLMDNSAEKQTQVNTAFSMLTAEAKFVLYALFQTPGELSQMLFADRPTKYTVRKYLTMMGWGIPEIAKTLRELRIFSKDLLED
jgi:hypothetical protein